MTPSFPPQNLLYCLFQLRPYIFTFYSILDYRSISWSENNYFNLILCENHLLSRKLLNITYGVYHYCFLLAITNCHEMSWWLGPADFIGGNIIIKKFCWHYSRDQGFFFLGFLDTNVSFIFEITEVEKAFL